MLVYYSHLGNTNENDKAVLPKLQLFPFHGYDFCLIRLAPVVLKTVFFTYQLFLLTSLKNSLNYRQHDARPELPATNRKC